MKSLDESDDPMMRKLDEVVRELWRSAREGCAQAVEHDIAASAGGVDALRWIRECTDNVYPPDVWKPRPGSHTEKMLALAEKHRVTLLSAKARELPASLYDAALDDAILDISERAARRIASDEAEALMLEAEAIAACRNDRDELRREADVVRSTLTPKDPTYE